MHSVIPVDSAGKALAAMMTWADSRSESIAIKIRDSKQGEEIMDLFKKLNEEDGVTIIQVTHSEKNAAYGSRVIHLLDGRIEKEEINN